jgi:murein DD-endopeptidase MepM/ murein hydrolase activator NlpD
MLFCATLYVSQVSAARAIDSPGGTPAPIAPPSPVASVRSGGVGASASAASNTGGSGGSAAPATKGTGGSEYGVVVPRPRAVRRSAPRRPSRPRRAPSRSKSKPKAAPKPRPSKPVPPPQPPPAASEPGVPSPAQTTAEGAVFPVAGLHSFGNAENRFGAGRVGHIHQGQDVLASEGLAVVAPLAGTIITTGYQAGGAGWYAAEHTIDGLDFFYAHCQASSLAVAAGQAVSAGQAICDVGQTGDATGPHLHFEVWVGGWRAATGHPIDPLPYLEAWDRTAAG